MLSPAYFFLILIVYNRSFWIANNCKTKFWILKLILALPKNCIFPSSVRIRAV